MIPPEHRKKAAWAVICISAVCAEEGIRTVAYKDVVGIPTVCFGETKGVHLGDKYTAEQCKDMLDPRIEEFGAGVDACIHHPLSDTRKAAFVSFAYNAGVSAFCHSGVAREENNHHPAAACKEMLRWNMAGGKVVQGLVNRRKEEFDLCMKDLP